MKKYVLFVLTLIISCNVHANRPIEQAVNKFKAISDVSGYYDVLNDFERIIALNDSSWICYYYSSLCLLNIAMNSPIDKIDQLCDKADNYIDKADKLSPKNSEIYCLKALSNSVRIRVDSQNRGYKYVILSNEYLTKASLYDSLNPRVFYLKAKNIENTPEMLGGGITAAITYYEEALKLFNEQLEKEKTLQPSWGRLSCNEIINKNKSKNGK